jgi:hypothetical protein
MLDVLAIDGEYKRGTVLAALSPRAHNIGD